MVLKLLHCTPSWWMHDQLTRLHLCTGLTSPYLLPGTQNLPGRLLFYVDFLATCSWHGAGCALVLLTRPLEITVAWQQTVFCCGEVCLCMLFMLCMLRCTARGSKQCVCMCEV